MSPPPSAADAALARVLGRIGPAGLEVPPGLGDVLDEPGTPAAVVVTWLAGLPEGAHAGPWLVAALAETTADGGASWAAAGARVFGEAMREPLGRLAEGAGEPAVSNFLRAGPEPALARALDLLQPETAASCVSALIALWRLRLDPLLAELIDAVDEAWIPALPPDAVRRALAARATPAELGSASWAGSIGTGRSVAGVLKSILRISLTSPADPRRARRLAWLAVGLGVTTEWVALARHTRDVRLGFGHRDQPQVRSLGPEDRTRVRAALRSLGRTPVDERSVLEQRLLREVYAEPDDDGPREVIADFWVAAGDPRGPFVRAQLGAGAGAGEVAGTECAPMGSDGAWNLYGADPARTTFFRGFPYRANLARLHGLRWDPGWATVRCLDSAPVPAAGEPLLRVLASPALRHVEEIDTALGPELIQELARARGRPFRLVRATRDELWGLGPETTDGVRVQGDSVRGEITVGAPPVPYRDGAVMREFPAVRFRRLVVFGVDDVGWWLGQTGVEHVTIELSFREWETGWVLELTRGPTGRLSHVDAHWRGPPLRMGARGLLGVLAGLPSAAVDRLRVRAPADLLGLHELRTVLPRLRGELEVDG